MVPRSPLLALLLTAAASFLSTANALECVVCAEGSLDEFGECASQFRYDCTSYAAAFSPSEKIFCRTTRKRELNNTYTVAKECISEKDHNKLFPAKGYPLEEECDLLEVSGSETAYCLCRHDRCNSKPIAEQFMAFEDKHPELFGELDDSSLSEELEDEIGKESVPRPRPSLPLAKSKAVKPGGVAFGTPQLAPIMPVNDPRFQGSLVENTLRRSQPVFVQDKASEVDVNDDRMRAILPTRGLDAPTVRRISTGDAPIVPEEVSGGKLPVKSVDTLSPWSSARSLAEEESAIESVSSSALLRCMQCGEGGLDDGATDCVLQTPVTCKNENSLCFTRYISVGNGQNAVEKMCVTKEALKGEYGDAFDVEDKASQCTVASAGRVRVCVCATGNDCNAKGIQEQVSSSTHGAKAAAAVPLPAPVIPIEPPTADLASSRVDAVPNPAPISTDFGGDPFKAREAPRPALNVDPVPKPIVPVEVRGPAPALKVETVPSGMHCAKCSVEGLSDPTADCSNPSTMECMAPAGERTYCLTRQTQLADGLFSVDKLCMTGLEFSDDFPEETAAPGCGTAFDGLVNYCLCRGEMCNRDSLLAQAQSNLPESAQVTTTTTTRRPNVIKNVAVKEQQPEMAMEESEQPPVVPVPSRRGEESRRAEQIPDFGQNMIVPPPPPRQPEPEEEQEMDRDELAKLEKQQREQKWRDDSERLLRDAASVSSFSTIVPSLLLAAVGVLLR